MRKECNNAKVAERHQLSLVTAYELATNPWNREAALIDRLQRKSHTDRQTDRQRDTHEGLPPSCSKTLSVARNCGPGHRGVIVHGGDMAVEALSRKTFLRKIHAYLWRKRCIFEDKCHVRGKGRGQQYDCWGNSSRHRRNERKRS